MIDLNNRVDFIGHWLYSGSPNSYSLPTFFFPQGFMTSSLQTYARKSQIAIDTLKFKSNVRKEYFKDIKEAPEDGVNVHGLFLQGARWNLDEGKVADSKKGALFFEFPVIWLEPISENKQDDERFYNILNIKLHSEEMNWVIQVIPQTSLWILVFIQNKSMNFGST